MIATANSAPCFFLQRRFCPAAWQSRLRHSGRHAARTRIRPRRADPLPCCRLHGNSPRTLRVPLESLQVAPHLRGMLVPQGAILLQCLAHDVFEPGRHVGIQTDGGCGPESRIALKFSANASPGRATFPSPSRTALRRMKTGRCENRDLFPSPVPATCMPPSQPSCPDWSSAARPTVRVMVWRRPLHWTNRQLVLNFRQPKIQILACPRLVTKMLLA